MNNNNDTVLVPVIHENSLNSGAELRSPDTYRRVFRYHLPSKDCFFIRAGNTGDMKPVIEPGAFVLIKPLMLTLPVKHNLIDRKHPRLLKNRTLVAVIYQDELLLRRASSSVDPQHRPLNVYLFSHEPKNFQTDAHPIIPEADKPLRVIGKVVEVINRY